jgi:hypothetical protein
MAWLCQCGNGNLVDDTPPICPLCGFDFEAHVEAILLVSVAGDPFADDPGNEATAIPF